VTLTYPRGSEWRVWDLHVHTPKSHGYRGDWENFVIQLGNADCGIIGLNDYFSVAGYREVLRRLNEKVEATGGDNAYREALEKLRVKTLFPVIECRMQNVLLNRNGKSGVRLNFHIIFSNKIDPAEIETLIKGFSYTKNATIGEQYIDGEFLLNKVTVDFFSRNRQIAKRYIPRQISKILRRSPGSAGVAVEV
jgi:hypothetical protein